jgi:hypothetical protein
MASTRWLFAALLGLAVAALAAAPAALAQGTGSVANATFTSAISEGAPVDFRQEFSSTVPVVYYYGELLDLNGQTVTFRWSLEGKRMQESIVKVTRDRQPSWSAMKMQPQWTGDWTAEVVDGKGRVLDRRNFALNAPL